MNASQKFTEQGNTSEAFDRSSCDKNNKGFKENLCT